MDNLMERVHKVQLEMALEVKRICKKYDINYSIIAGTLLGAVRHKGFIPWDDDIDIGMIREDFNKFIIVARDNLKAEYFLQTWESDKGFALPIAKLRKNGTKYVEQNSSGSDLHCGIYIDIFPFDNVPESIWKQKLQNSATYILKRILMVKQKYVIWDQNERFKKLVYKLITTVTIPLSIEKTKQILYHQMTKYNEDVTETVVAFGGSYGYWKESIQKKWITNITNINFEEYELSCPQDYSNYLIHFYGDYMTPYSEDMRYNRHKIIKIEFDVEIL